MAYINGKKVLQVVQSLGGTSSTLLTTTTDATLVSGTTYELALTYLTGTPAVNDFIAYVDSGAITTLYKVTAVDSTNAMLDKIGDIGGGGGSTLYYHAVKITYSTALIGYFRFLSAYSTNVNSKARLISLLSDNSTKLLGCNGQMRNPENVLLYLSNIYISNSKAYIAGIRYNNSTVSELYINSSDNYQYFEWGTIEDTVKSL